MDENIGRTNATVRVILGAALVTAAILLAFVVQTAAAYVAVAALGVVGLAVASSGVNRTSRVRGWMTRHA